MRDKGAAGLNIICRGWTHGTLGQQNIIQKKRDKGAAGLNIICRGIQAHSVKRETKAI